MRHRVLSPLAAPALHPTRAADPYLVLSSLWLLVFSVTTQSMIIAPILPRIAEQVAVPASRLGLLVTGYSAAVAVVALVMGPVSDRVGRRRMLLAGSAVMALGLALHGLARDYPALLAVRVLTGAGGGVLTGATGAYIGDYFPSRRRGWANGWIMSGMAAGQILGLPLGAVLAGRSGFGLPFVILAFTMVAAWVMVWRFVPQPAVQRLEGGLGVRRALGHYARMVARPDVSAATLAFPAMFLGTSLYVLYLPVWLEGTRGATPGEVALLFGLGGVATVLAGPPAGKLSDRVGRRRVVVATSVGTAIAMLATTVVVREIWISYLLFFLLMALFAARAAPFQALMTEIVPPEQRGSLMSLTMALGQVGTAAGAAIAGPAYGAYGYASNTALGAASALLIALLVWRFLPEPPAEPERPGGPPLAEAVPDSDF